MKSQSTINSEVAQDKAQLAKDNQWFVEQNGCRIEIKSGEGFSIALSKSPENEKLAERIVRAVNEHAALCAVADFANHKKSCTKASSAGVSCNCGFDRARFNLATVRAGGAK